MQIFSYLCTLYYYAEVYTCHIMDAFGQFDDAFRGVSAVSLCSLG